MSLKTGDLDDVVSAVIIEVLETLVVRVLNRQIRGFAIAGKFESGWFRGLVSN